MVCRPVYLKWGAITLNGFSIYTCPLKYYEFRAIPCKRNSYFKMTGAEHEEGTWQSYSIYESYELKFRFRNEARRLRQLVQNTQGSRRIRALRRARVLQGSRCGLGCQAKSSTRHEYVLESRKRLGTLGLRISTHSVQEPHDNTETSPFS